MNTNAYNISRIEELTRLIFQHKSYSKTQLATLVQKEFNLTKDRSVYYCDDFAIRFSKAATEHFSNTVLSLSALQKYDNRPFFVCVSLPTDNYLLLANSTFIRKISHSSKELRENNIRGSFNGSDILREYASYSNEPANFVELYRIHAAFSWEENLCRLVEATNNIAPVGQKTQLNEQGYQTFMDAPYRAVEFCQSPCFLQLQQELDERVKAVEDEILIAAFIENVKIRGNIIEYLISNEESLLKEKIKEALHQQTMQIPDFHLRNDLGDYNKTFVEFDTKTDIKTHILYLNSNPKAYNLDKLIDFLSHEKSVYMLYLVGITAQKEIKTAFVSMYQKQLLSATLVMPHWSGRNSRGTAQFEGKTITQILSSFSNEIDIAASQLFNEKIINL